MAWMAFWAVTTRIRSSDRKAILRIPLGGGRWANQSRETLQRAAAAFARCILPRCFYCHDADRCLRHVSQQCADTGRDIDGNQARQDE